MNNFKVLCIYHSIDIDGWMSAAITAKYYREKYNNITLYPYNYNDEIDINEMIEEFDTIITVDVSLELDDIEKIFNSKTTNFIYIDHHKRKIEEVFKRFFDRRFIHKINTADEPKDRLAACELTWQYFYPNDKMPELIKQLGAYDSFRLESFNEEEKMRTFYIQYGARAYIYDVNSANGYLYTNDNDTVQMFDIVGRGIYNYLKVQGRETFKKDSIITVLEDINGISYMAKAVNIDRFNPKSFDLNIDNCEIIIVYKISNKFINVSIYPNNDKIDASLIAKNYGGGGHKGAAGFRIKTKDYAKFFNEILSY